MGSQANLLHVSVQRLGAGCGVAGIGLNMQGANCVLTDVAHVTPLLRYDYELNQLEGNTTVVDYEWDGSEQRAV